MMTMTTTTMMVMMFQSADRIEQPSTNGGDDAVRGMVSSWTVQKAPSRTPVQRAAAPGRHAALDRAGLGPAQLAGPGGATSSAQSRR